MEKNAIADIVGNLNVGADKVQVGYMFYSKRSRSTLSIAKKEQIRRDRKFYIDRVKQLPYMPFETTPLLATLQYSNEKIFSIKREENSLLPRIAVLFNDIKGNDDLNLIQQEAFKLKSQGVEVFTVGIGSSVDYQQLGTIASDSSHVIRVRDHKSIYESISEIAQNICTVYSKMSLDKEELVTTGKDDYRYFRIDLNNLQSPLIEIRVSNLIGVTDVYYSFSERTPTLENSDRKFQIKKKIVNTKIIETSLIFVVPSTDHSTLYFTIAGIEENNTVTVIVKNDDF